ncbi:MAG: tetratricopeptide repeat protein [Bacteroidota bacterium]
MKNISYRLQDTSYKLMLILLLFNLQSSSFNSFAQNTKIDSLMVLLKNDIEDTNKITHLNILCREHINISNYDTAFHYVNATLQLAKQLNFSKGIATAYNNIGTINNYQGNYDTALENYFKALKIYEAVNDKYGMALSYNNIGIIYDEQGNYDKALENYFTALKIKKEIGDKKSIATSYANIGVVFDEQGKTDNAMENYLNAFKIYEAIGDKYCMALSYNNIGIIYNNQGRYELALKNYFKSLKIEEEIGDKQGIASSYNNIGIVYKNLKQSVLAMEYYNKALDVSKEIGSKEDIKESYQNFFEIYVQISDYKNAYEYYRLYSQIKDSIFDEEGNKHITEMQTKYETEKKDKTIQIQQLLIQKKEYQLYRLLAFAVLIVIITILLMQQYRSRTKQRTTELQQKLLRAQMNPHFLFNSLFSIQSFMLENNSEDAAVYLAKFAELMRQILDNSREEYIPIQKEIKTLENYLDLQKLRYEDKFDYKIILDEQIDAEFTAIPPMLAQPFIENVIEHAFSKEITA